MKRFAQRQTSIIALAFVLAAAACSGGDAGRSASAAAAAPATNGPAAPLLDLARLKPDFDFQGRIIFQSDADGDNEIYELTRDGVRKLTDNAWNDEYPRWSPDRSRIAFAANPRSNYDIFVMNADGTGTAAVVATPADETEPAWLADGAGLAFSRGDAIWTIDLATKAERRVLPDFSPAHRLADFAPASGLAAFTGKRLLGWDVFAADLARGTVAPLTEGGKSCRPRFSRDGKRIAYVSSAADGKGDIWLMNPDGSGKTRLTERNETVDYFPAWSPDDKYIVFCSSTEHSPEKGRWSLFLVKTATKLVTPLFSGFERALFPDWR
jgi:Tol biopolymer transport system component